MSIERTLRHHAATAAAVQAAIAGQQIARQEVAKALRAERVRREVSLRATARAHNISAAYLSDIEKGRRWNTELIRVIAQWLRR